MSRETYEDIPRRISWEILDFFCGEDPKKNLFWRNTCKSLCNNPWRYFFKNYFRKPRINFLWKFFGNPWTIFKMNLLNNFLRFLSKSKGNSQNNAWKKPLRNYCPNAHRIVMAKLKDPNDSSWNVPRRTEGYREGSISKPKCWVYRKSTGVQWWARYRDESIAGEESSRSGWNSLLGVCRYVQVVCCIAKMTGGRQLCAYMKCLKSGAFDLVEIFS